MEEDVDARETRPNWALRLWITQLTVAILAVAYVLFRRISTPHCALECDFELLRTAGNTYALFALLLLPVTGIWSIVNRLAGFGESTRRWDWCIPAAGTLLTLAGAFVANYFSDVALLFV